MKEDIQKIIRAAIWAPSGDNVQPWRFLVSENKIKVINIPEKDNSLYNFKQNASYVAHGALVENIRIAANYFGYKNEIYLLPKEKNITATIILHKTNDVQPNDFELFGYIEKRVSNRKRYKNAPLDDKDKKEIMNSLTGLKDIRVKFVEEELKEKAAKMLSRNEKIVLENRNLHNFLFKHITWAKTEDKEKKGFYIKTLEMKPIEEFIFKLCKNASILNALNKIISISNIVSKENKKLYSNSSAIGAIITTGNSSLDFLKTGIVLQKIWLTATKLELALQPLTGIMFLMQRVLHNEIKDISQEHILIIKESYRELENIFGVKNEVISMGFRIGYAESPSAKTERLDPEIVEI